MPGGDPLPAGLRGFDMPPGMDLEFPTLQMNTDARDTISLLDSSVYLPFDGTMSMGLCPGDQRLPQSFPSSSFQPSAAALLDRTEQPSVPDEAMPRTPRTGSTPREGMSAAIPQTEFTKRRNWPTTVVEELQDLLHILDANGRIKHVSPSAERLTGYTPAELGDQFMRNLLHPDDVGIFTSELNESMASGHPLRMFYRLKKKDGSYAVFESVGHAHIAAARFAPNVNNQTPFCQAVFMMARPYPTKNAALLDSFLEHKMENERLKRKIAELRKEEQEEAEEEPEWVWRQRREGPSDTSTRPAMAPLLQSLTDTSLPPRERREYLDSVAAESGSAAGPTQQHPPTSGPSRADTIEMLTGLRYQEGERSLGITTGNPSAALVTGDVGIAIAVDRDGRAGEKKKKVKVAEEYVCTDCGTLESPEWRKGPSGPKTLCNACGLRWAKKEKKKGAGPVGAAGP